jgi:methionyl-tRNA synthetase
MAPYYITTPIYYVNDRPHIGHCYTTVVADVAARFQRLIRGEMQAAGEGGVFLLTGTDEHADKVVTSAAERGLSPQEWADRNAQAFREAFEILRCSNDDFIRTTENRHKDKVPQYIRRLREAGHIYKGDYTGWYDPSQEEYITETAAREHGFNSPVSGKPLVKRTEQNYFFRLSAFAEGLQRHIEAHREFILPEARRNEVLGRIRAGLQDVPISRAVGPEGDTASRWGILMPDDPSHRIYVWIDALFNYLTVVDTPQRRRYWPPAVHVLGKDILWFHAVIWPAMLMALGEPLPRTIYAHSWWVSEGRKMSKSLGNFIEFDQLRGYIEKFGVDALRWFMATQGPLGANDADFAHSKFIEVYNADLANGIGNSTSRVANMIAKYFDGKVPPHPDAAAEPATPPGDGRNWGQHIARLLDGDALAVALDAMAIDQALVRGSQLVTAVDAYISETRPFSLAKEIANPGDAKQRQLETILYQCAEALRIASLLMWPAMPDKMADLWKRWNCTPAPGVPLDELARFAGEHGLKPGTPLEKGDALFMRADPADPPPLSPE